MARVLPGLLLPLNIRVREREDKGRSEPNRQMQAYGGLSTFQCNCETRHSMFTVQAEPRVEIQSNKNASFSLTQSLFPEHGQQPQPPPLPEAEPRKSTSRPHSADSASPY